MLIVLPLLACAATALRSAPFPQNYGDYTVSRIPRQRQKAQPSELKITENVVELTRARSGRSLSSTIVHSMRQFGRSRVSRVANGTTAIDAVAGGQVFSASVVVGGGQEFSVVIDTGSSDPWLVTTDFICRDVVGHTVQEQSYCGFGEMYDPSRSLTYQPISDLNFNITYADGEYLTGDLAYETFTMAGIEVQNQQFGVVDRAAWFGDHTTAGLVGFAYRSLVSAYAGTDLSTDSPSTRCLYNPLFVNMFENENIAPVFSMAIDRDLDKGGVMALGGIPDIPHSPHWVSVEIEPVGVNQTNGQEVYEFYTIEVGGYAYSNVSGPQFNVYDNANPTKIPVVQNSTRAIVDSGTSLCYVPDAVADALAMAFNPPAWWSSDNDAYMVDCEATAPVFGVVIADKIFYVNALDLIVLVEEGQCAMGVQPAQGGLSILGGTWMKNVIAVFDIGAEEMRFAAREFYSIS
ncbi:hypothetical protein DOTSEDRAFT_49872 [Dothistroma septosporum NZE10]|uniref:Peptidase A1 domain-containing protein n=1 Tax=Dothistroma septosporum (strain NZE10 / CBS 128990) TaxID=675120 RepID=N1Q362_DOTSN|nr:hypothetical protein DOTSEDRAFT_49872 [Dothistroma septosporum NZE10]